MISNAPPLEISKENNKEEEGGCENFFQNVIVHVKVKLLKGGIGHTYHPRHPLL